MEKHSTHRNQLIPYYPKESLLFPHIQSYIEQNSEITHNCDVSEMIRNELYSSYDSSEFDVIFFSLMTPSVTTTWINQLCLTNKYTRKNANLDYIIYHHARSISGSEIFFENQDRQNFKT